MFTNRNGCTVWERTVGADRMEAYIRHDISAVYWQELHGQSAGDGKGRNPENSVLCIIPANSLQGYIPKPDDLICDIISDTDEPPESCLTVTQIKNFLYGSADVQHIEVTAV